MPFFILRADLLRWLCLFLLDPRCDIQTWRTYGGGGAQRPVLTLQLKHLIISFLALFSLRGFLSCALKFLRGSHSFFWVPSSCAIGDFQLSSSSSSLVTAKTFLLCILFCSSILSSFCSRLRRASSPSCSSFRPLPAGRTSFRLALIRRVEKQFLCLLHRVNPVLRLQVSEMFGRRAPCLRSVRLVPRVTIFRLGLRPHWGLLGQTRTRLLP